MTDEKLKSLVIERLKQKGVLAHSQHFRRAADIVNLMRLEPDQRERAQQIAKEWVE